VPKPQCVELPGVEPIPILYENRSVLAMDKPRGWMLVPFSWQKTSRNLQAALTSSIAAGDFLAMVDITDSGSGKITFANLEATISHDNIAGVSANDHHTQLHAAAHADGAADELAVQDLASDAATDGQVPKADGAGAVAFEDDIKGLSFTIDGGGSAITTGIKGVLIVPFACTITAWNVVADASGSINVDVNRSAWNVTPSYASIAASAHPALTTAIAAENTTLTGWTTTLAAQDILQFEVDSATTVKVVTVLLKVKRT